MNWNINSVKFSWLIRAFHPFKKINFEQPCTSSVKVGKSGPRKRKAKEVIFNLSQMVHWNNEIVDQILGFSNDHGLYV